MTGKALREDRHRRHSFTFNFVATKEETKGSKIIDGQRKRIAIVDSSDDEYRYGILGKSLEKTRLIAKNANNSDDENLKSGFISGLVLSQKLQKDTTSDPTVDIAGLSEQHGFVPIIQGFDLCGFFLICGFLKVYEDFLDILVVFG